MARPANTEGLIRQYFTGAKVQMEIHARPVIDPMTMARRRGLVTRKVTSCTACELHCGMPHGPVPFSGPSTGLFAAIGEGPGSDESRLVKPFVGKSGKLLRAMLGQVGIPGDQVLFANMVSCWPRTEGKGADTRSPSNVEAMACRDNLILQVGLIDAPFVLLVGGNALKAVRPDLKVSKHHGLVFLWNITYGEDMVIESKWVMPIYHPAAILRQRAHKEPTMKELRLWADLVKGELDPASQITDSCVICNDWIGHHDPDGVGYCSTHWPRHGNDWKLAREFWLPKREGGHAQGSLI